MDDSIQKAANQIEIKAIPFTDEEERRFLTEPVEVARSIVESNNSWQIESLRQALRL